MLTNLLVIIGILIYWSIAELVIVYNLKTRAVENNHLADRPNYNQHDCVEIGLCAR